MLTGYSSVLLGLKLRAESGGSGGGSRQFRCLSLIFDGVGVGWNDIEVEVVRIEVEWLPCELETWFSSCELSAMARDHTSQAPGSPLPDSVGTRAFVS